jgi:hypothetical protein
MMTDWIGEPELQAPDGEICPGSHLTSKIANLGGGAAYFSAYLGISEFALSALAHLW